MHPNTVLFATQLKVGKNEDCFPNNGRWNFKTKVLHYCFTFRKYSRLPVSYLKFN